jgi:hypothetical protein
MVRFFDTYNQDIFTKLIAELPLPKFVQSATAQLEPNNEIVQMTSAQFENIIFAYYTAIKFSNRNRKITSERFNGCNR